ncbi:tumor necrosis factor receptor superfamily member 11B [Elgaria multicarinata webbii]|uniref:tumor necrosis factor receptor superfamily member 11B n=1 Tax=Elgaria multicarinata webbii TaxID=159646 RepID=UPI002FCCFFFB
MNKFLCCTLVLLGISVKWTVQVIPRTYLHYDRMTGRQLTCDECPPATYVKRHCTTSSKTECAPCPDQHYSDDWNSDDECYYCDVVCKELQFVVVECSNTTNRYCECIEGRYLDLEFCARHTVCPPGFGVVQQGTPERDTVCQRCPAGYFSSERSSKEACRPHTDCSALNLKMVWKGDATRDNMCRGERNHRSEQQCEIDVTLCEEAFFRFGVPTKLSPNWLETLKDSLPGEKVNAETLESIKQRDSPQEQTFQLLKLWKQQNKDHDMVKNIIQGINHCENTVLKHIGHLNITFEQLNVLMENLPGKKVGKEETEPIVRMCKPTEQIFKLLNLWRVKNRDQDTIKGLMYGLKHLKTYHFPKTTIQGLRKVVKFLHSLHKLYQKLFFEILGNQSHLVKARRG